MLTVNTIPSPKVLFDVVPGIKFQDAIKLISMQPIASNIAAWKRCMSNLFELELQCPFLMDDNIIIMLLKLLVLKNQFDSANHGSILLFMNSLFMGLFE